MLTDDQRMLNEVEQTFRQFVVMPNDHCYTVATLWVAHTHLRDSASRFLPYITPRLYYGSKVAGCGKSLALKVTTYMSHNGDMVLEPTPPSITTMINDDLCTLGFDEIDLYFGRGTGKTAMRTILNGGYERGAFVTKRRQDEVVRENVHAPVVMAGKNANRFLNSESFETLRTRSIPIILEQKPAGAEVERFNPEVHVARLRGIGHGLKRWGLHNGRAICAVDAAMPAAITNRAEEIWTVLFRIATYVGGEWPDKVNAAARAMVLGEYGDDTPQVSPAEDLLIWARTCFTNDEHFLPTNVLINRLHDVPGDHWWHHEWITDRAAGMSLSRMLKVFGIEHTRAYVDGVQCWGYRASELGSTPTSKPEDDVWSYDEDDQESTETA